MVTAMATAMAMGQGEWGNSNGETYVLLQQKTSTIVVDQTVQTVWTADIHDVLCSNKTCMMWSGILFGVSE
jgi:hypothetical protein